MPENNEAVLQGMRSAYQSESNLQYTVVRFTFQARDGVVVLQIYPVVSIKSVTFEVAVYTQ